MIKNYDIFSGKDLEIADLILRRRMQMLVHSYIYYKLNTNIISDRQFDTWGKELVQLQKDYPNIASQVEYAEDFQDWDASTGFHLPINNQIIRIAYRLIHKSASTVKPKSTARPKSVAPTKTKTARKSLF